MPSKQTKKVREKPMQRYYRDRGDYSYLVHCTREASKDPKFWEAMDALIDGAVKHVERPRKGRRG